MAITEYQEAIHYQRHCKTLGLDPLSQDELNEMKAVRDDLCQHYGESFDSEYGWASNVLGKAKPRFTDIEQDVNLAHLRPFYKLANINVHAGSKGILYRLGSPGEGRSLLVAGPSIFGLSEAGQNTAISMNQITGTLLLTKPNLDRLAFVATTQKLVGKIFEEFAVAHERLEQQSAG